MSKYVLMHGTFVELSDEELMHWKYIKREKKNGKWVYYYHDDDVKKAEAAYKKASLKRGSALDKYDTIVKNRPKDSSGDPSYAQFEKDYAKKANTAMSDWAAAKQKYEKTVEKYNKSFGHTVASALNKASDKLNKAKNWLKSLI